MKVFRIVKKLFFIGLTILSNFTNASLLNAIPLNATTLSCISMNQKLLMLTVIIPYFILLVLKQVNVVAVVIILIIHTQKFVSLIL